MLENGFRAAAFRRVIMSGRVESKIAVVTGGTSGIGLATAKLLASEGAKVFVTGRRSRELASAVEQIGHGAVGIQGDVSRLDDLERLFTAVREQEGRWIFCSLTLARLNTPPSSRSLRVSLKPGSPRTSRAFSSACRRLCR